MRKFFENALAVISCVILILVENWGKIAIVVFMAFIVVAITKIEPRKYQHEYQVGDIVCMKITDDKVQVLDASPNSSTMEIRIVVQSVIKDNNTVTSVREYDTMRVQGFELGECK